MRTQASTVVVPTAIDFVQDKAHRYWQVATHPMSSPSSSKGKNLADDTSGAYAGAEQSEILEGSSDPTSSEGKKLADDTWEDDHVPFASAPSDDDDHIHFSSEDEGEEDHISSSTRVDDKWYVIGSVVLNRDPFRRSPSVVTCDSTISPLSLELRRTQKMVSLPELPETLEPSTPMFFLKTAGGQHGQRRDSGIAQVHNPGSSIHRMNDMVHDIVGPDFDWEQDREQVMNSDAKAFFKLLDEGSEPLWPGCTKQTTLFAVATLLNIKADHNMSHECFESLLKAIKSMLPDGEKLPDNYYFYHPFRRNRENFSKGKVENDMPAPRLSETEMLDRVMRLLVIQFGKIAASEIINGFGDSHNWVRRSIFWELPYWSTNLIRQHLDVMHIEKNVFDNVFSTVMGVPGKTKDNDKARLDMKDICKRPGLELYETPNGKIAKPHAKYTLSKKQVEDVCTWIKSLKLPDGYASNIARCVTGGKLQGMKSQDCHVFMERVMHVAFRDLLDKPIWDALTDLCRFFRDICSKTLNENDMSILEKNIIEITYYFPDEVLTKANRVPRHDDGGNVELNSRLSVFGLPGRAYGKGKRIFLYEQELQAAHTYILFNCEEIDDFVSLKKSDLPETVVLIGNDMPSIQLYVPSQDISMQLLKSSIPLQGV
ncbi:hypothetical protein MRB53_034168 [Persea americana]|uniref:Uncharacterized protein n=1 Tax=Persea americana TaxID=3435 RepID=A0ACC2KWZ6_PERAE|nr:hypothetical protein MRB53_034168 [Persea americana]